MKVLLTSNASYAPPRGGSTRSNLVWLRGLVERGHEVRVLSAAWGEAEQCGGEWHCDSVGVKNLPLNSAVLREEILTFAPDVVLVSSEDLSHRLVREASRWAKVIYLAHTPQFFPFGPESWNSNAEATEAIRGAAAVVAIGTHMAGYIERHAGCKVTVIHPPIYGEAPFPRFGNFESGDVVMINPCAVKGISIFLAGGGDVAASAFYGAGGLGDYARGPAADGGAAECAGAGERGRHR